ncbi:hypothetical protein HDV03_002086 [Kappamyces sp. JEL0829]|nr:hypothetical protein HDV03_002086 [Kappamyces sp. JEL0829]
MENRLYQEFAKTHTRQQIKTALHYCTGYFHIARALLKANGNIDHLDSPHLANLIFTPKQDAVLIKHRNVSLGHLFSFVLAQSELHSCALEGWARHTLGALQERMLYLQNNQHQPSVGPEHVSTAEFRQLLQTGQDGMVPHRSSTSKWKHS